MEFIERNFLATTTAMTVDSNTTSAKNIINWDERYQYVSDGYDNDLTSTTFTYSFDETTTVTRVALLEHNLKDFSIYYNGTTASTFSMSTTAATTSSIFTSNSETAQYFFTDSVDCTSVSIQMNKTQTADVEKAVGFFLVSTLKLDFDRIPNAQGYKPRQVPKQVIHRMSDGGTRRHKTSDKWHTDLKFKDVTLAFRDSLHEIFIADDSFVFTPFGTSTAWDTIMFDAVWSNNFEFYSYAENSTQQGFKGNIKLMERS